MLSNLGWNCTEVPVLQVRNANSDKQGFEWTEFYCIHNYGGSIKISS